MDAEVALVDLARRAVVERGERRRIREPRDGQRAAERLPAEADVFLDGEILAEEAQAGDACAAVPVPRVELRAFRVQAVIGQPAEDGERARRGGELAQEVPEVVAAARREQEEGARVRCLVELAAQRVRKGAGAFLRRIEEGKAELRRGEEGKGNHGADGREASVIDDARHAAAEENGIGEGAVHLGKGPLEGWFVPVCGKDGDERRARRGAERRELLCRRTDDARQGAFVLEVEDQLFHNIPTFFRNCWRWQQLLSQYDIKIAISQYISIVIVALWI